MKYLGFLLTLVFFTGSLFAGEGDEILKKVEKTMNAPKDRFTVMKMKLIESDGTVKERKMKSIQLGDEKRLVQFVEPDDVKGVSFLSLSNNNYYLYMPAFKKIRRIASHVKNQNFMGTDFSYDDMGNLTLSDDYNAKVIKKNGDIVVLQLTPKNPEDVDYSKLIATVDTKNYTFKKVEYYDKSGKLKKVMTVKKISKRGKYWSMDHMIMHDVQKNHKTEMIIEKVKFDIGLTKRDFSKRRMKKSLNY